MREIRLSGSVEGVVSNHDPYSDSTLFNRGRSRICSADPSAAILRSAVKFTPWGMAPGGNIDSAGMEIWMARAVGCQFAIWAAAGAAGR
jgi:hypothetical protein